MREGEKRGGQCDRGLFPGASAGLRLGVINVATSSRVSDPVDCARQMTR